MKPKRYLASFRSYVHCKFWGLGRDPQIGGRGGLGVKNGPIRKCNIGFLLAPHSDQSAISNRFHRTQQCYRQTDRQNWYSNSRPDAARYALASVAKTDDDDLITIETVEIIQSP